MITNGCPDCEKSTSGSCYRHAMLILNVPFKLYPTPEQGWQCPICREVNAPSQLTCANKHGKKAEDA